MNSMYYHIKHKTVFDRFPNAEQRVEITMHEHSSECLIYHLIQKYN